jgi:deoxyribodipyrimidine photo-lyase
MGRFDPKGLLNETPEPLAGPAPPDRRAPPEGEDPRRGLRTGLLLTEEDLSPRFVLERLDAPPVAHATLCSVDAGRPGECRKRWYAFTRDAIADARGRWADGWATAGPDTSEPRRSGTGRLRCGAGAGRDRLRAGRPDRLRPAGPGALLGDAGITLVRVLREEDRAAWPFATHGFFRFKDEFRSYSQSLGSWG